MQLYAGPAYPIRPLRARRKRPSDPRAAEQRDEFAPV
jgi:hypothetical protein